MGRKDNSVFSFFKRKKRKLTPKERNELALERARAISDKMVKDKDVGYICTFHSLAAKALREDIHCVGIVPNFTIMDTEDQNSILLEQGYNSL